MLEEVGGPVGPDIVSEVTAVPDLGPPSPDVLPAAPATPTSVTSQHDLEWDDIFEEDLEEPLDGIFTIN
mgnify:CR=1 FL=1